MEALACVSLCINAGKTVVFTKALPPNSQILTSQEAIVAKGNDVGHKLNFFVEVYFAGWRQWDVNFEHHLSFTGRLKDVLCQQTQFLYFFVTFVSQFGFVSLTGSLHLSRVLFYCSGVIHWHGGYAEGSAGLPFV